MKCPNDDTILVMADRQGIEIDYCPQCRGVWLDRGELDKLIERSAGSMGSRQGNESEHTSPQPFDNHSRNYNDRQDYRYKKRKKESFLGDLFDF